MTLREAIVANARWGVDNEPQIHYSQGPLRMAGIGHPNMLPLSTDCSAFVTLCYNWAGAPDPNGRGYDGYGFTGTFLDNLTAILPDELLPGDPIVFGPSPGDHVVVAIEPGPDPMCVSHGQEAGPAYVRLSVEASYHRAPMTCLRGAGLDISEDDLNDADRAWLDTHFQQVIQKQDALEADNTDLRNEVTGLQDRLTALTNSKVAELQRNERRVAMALDAAGTRVKGVEGTVPEYPDYKP